MTRTSPGPARAARLLRALRRRAGAAGRRVHAARDGRDGPTDRAHFAVRDVRVDAERRRSGPDPLRAVGLRRSLQHALHESVVDLARRHRRAGRVRQLHGESALRVRSPAHSRFAQDDLHRLRPSRADRRLAGAARSEPGADGETAVDATDARSLLSRNRKAGRRRISPIRFRCPRTITWWRGVPHRCRPARRDRCGEWPGRPTTWGSTCSTPLAT